MSKSKMLGKRVYQDIRSALNDAEVAIGQLSSERSAIALQEDEYNTARLEASLDIVADGLSQIIDADADEPMTLDEILARYVRPGVVDEDVVMTAAKLVEGLGMVGSTVGGGLGIQEFDAGSLIDLVETLRDLVDYLEKETA